MRGVCVKSSEGKEGWEEVWRCERVTRVHTLLLPIKLNAWGVLILNKSVC